MSAESGKPAADNFSLSAPATPAAGNTTGTHNELADRLAHLLGKHHRVDAAIAGLSLHRWEHPTPPTSYMLAPSICLIGQGQKRLFLGDDVFVYDACTFLISSIELPVVTQIIEASPDQPYLGLTMDLDLDMISELMITTPQAPGRNSQETLGVAVSTLPDGISSAFVRLLELLDQPDDIATLAPLIQREIFYRLLKTNQGPRLRNIITSGNHSHQIAQVIEWLKANYTKPVKIETLANHAGMSVSAFHSHFRATTAMTPLQFLKRMRLNEARRLMLANQLDASRAAYEVGYESPSQFSREYSRMFGAPPIKDIRQLAASGMR